MIKCINCESNTHVVKQCNKPIYSYGIIGYTVIDNKINYCLIKKRSTYEYMNLIKNTKYADIDKFISKLTVYELMKLKNYSVERLFIDFFNNNHYLNNRNTQQYRNFEKKINLLRSYKNKITDETFNDIIDKYINELNLNETLWTFPSGRKKLNESYDDCAIREFIEETDIDVRNIVYFNGNIVIKDNYIGSDNLLYEILYFVCKLDSNTKLNINSNNYFQLLEITGVKWFSFCDFYINSLLNNVTGFNVDKKKSLIMKIHKTILYIESVLI